MVLEPVPSSPPVVERIVKAIEDAVAKGHLKPGQKLAGEVQLAQELGVSRPSVREALRVLSALGVVEVRRGEGTFITRPSFSKRIVDPLVLRLMLESPAAEHLMELRTIFETGYIGLVVEKLEADDLKILEDLVERFRDAVHAQAPVDTLLELDIAFHMQLLEMTRNPLMIELGKSLMHFFRPSIRKALIRDPKESLRGHEQILRCIVDRDVSGARQAVYENLVRWQKSLSGPASSEGEH